MPKHPYSLLLPHLLSPSSLLTFPTLVQASWASFLALEAGHKPSHLKNHQIGTTFTVTNRLLLFNLAVACAR